MNMVNKYCKYILILLFPAFVGSAYAINITCPQTIECTDYKCNAKSPADNLDYTAVYHFMQLDPSKSDKLVANFQGVRVTKAGGIICLFQSPIAKQLEVVIVNRIADTKQFENSNVWQPLAQSWGCSNTNSNSCALAVVQ